MFMYMCVCSVCLYKCVCMCGMSVIITIQYLKAIRTTSTPHTTSYVHVYSGWLYNINVSSVCMCACRCLPTCLALWVFKIQYMVCASHHLQNRWHLFPLSLTNVQAFSQHPTPCGIQSNFSTDLRRHVRGSKDSFLYLALKVMRWLKENPASFRALQYNILTHKTITQNCFFYIYIFLESKASV